jgi:4'-phosphopantetheinyl transferase
MVEVYWLEQTEADVESCDDWLTPDELSRCNSLRFSKRRAEWRLGRWTAKTAVTAYLHVPVLADIEIRAAASGAPQVFLGETPAACSISLTHRAGIAACAIASSGAAVGCDLEVIEPRSNAFISDYFTTEEQAVVARALPAERSRISALFWSAKESVLKVLRAGLRIDTRSVAVSEYDTLEPTPDNTAWRPLSIRYTDGRVFYGWWQSSGDLLRTLVASPPPRPPIHLREAR